MLYVLFSAICAQGGGVQTTEIPVTAETATTAPLTGRRSHQPDVRSIIFMYSTAWRMAAGIEADWPRRRPPVERLSGHLHVAACPMGGAVS